MIYILFPLLHLIQFPDVLLARAYDAHTYIIGIHCSGIGQIYKTNYHTNKYL